MTLESEILAPSLSWTSDGHVCDTSLAPYISQWTVAPGAGQCHPIASLMLRQGSGQMEGERERADTFSFVKQIIRLCEAI